MAADRRELLEVSGMLVVELEDTVDDVVVGSMLVDVVLADRLVVDVAEGTTVESTVVEVDVGARVDVGPATVVVEPSKVVDGDVDEDDSTADDDEDSTTDEDDEDSTTDEDDELTATAAAVYTSMSLFAEATFVVRTQE